MDAYPAVPPFAPDTSPDLRLFEAMPGISALILPDPPRFTIKAITEEFLEATGKQKEDLVGKSHFEPFPQNPEDLDFTGESNLRHSFAFVLTHKKRHHMPIQRYDIPNADGTFTERWWSVTNHPFLDASGSVQYIIHTARDITTLVKAGQMEEKIKGMEQAYHLFHQAPVAIHILNGPDQIIELANQACLEIWGKGPEVIGHSLLKVMPEFEQQGFRELVQEILRTGKTERFYESAVTLGHDESAQVRYFNWVIQPYDEKDRLQATRVLVFTTEVTQQVMARRELAAKEESLKESTDKFTTLLESLPQMTWTNLPDGEVNFYNRQWYRYTGLDLAQNDLLGWQDVVHPDDLASTLNDYQTALESGTVFMTENRIRRADGVYRWHLNRALPIRNEQGEILLWMGTITDIHDRKRTENALKESEQRIRSFVESAPFPIGVYTGREMKIELANQAILEAWGKGNDVIGKRYADVLPELDNQKIYEQLDGVFTTGIPFHARNQRVDLVVDGRLQPFYFNYSFTPLFDASGQVYGVMNTAADVTDLNQATQQVEESERNLRNIILQAPVAICIFRGEDYVIEIANTSMFAFWGRPAEEVLHRPLFEALPEVRNQGYEELMANVMRTGSSFSANEQPVTLIRNGQVQQTYVNFAYEPIREPDGTISRIIAMAADVTDQVLTRKKIEQSEQELRKRVAERTAELEEQKNLLDNILTNSSNGISVSEVIRDEEGVVVDARTILANESAVKFTGLPRDLYLSKTAVEIDPGIIHSDYYKGCVRTLETGEPLLIQYFLEPTGRWLELTVSRMDNEHLIHIFTDITAIKEAQLRLERTVEDLRRSNQNLEEFAYAASHDLKEPIRKIHFFSDRLKSSLHDRMQEEEQRSFERMETASKRMSTLIDDLLTYSQISLRPRTLEDVNLNQLMEQVLSDLDLEVEEKNARITMDKLGTVKGHHRQLQQAFQNLLGNALKYSKPGTPPEIHIGSTRMPGKDLGLNLSAADQARMFHVIRVRDNGIGFEQKDAERIFNVFTRLHGNSEFRGTGVGLSIVRKVLENHNGYITAESAPGKGALFQVYLPE